MPQKEPLIALSFVVIFGAIVAGYNLPADRLSAIGSIVAGVGSVLAVIWFSASLYYQGQQIKEQREQFNRNISHIGEESRRNALKSSKDILLDAEAKALDQDRSIGNINEIINSYLNSSKYLQPMIESKDPVEIAENFRLWIKVEGAALTLLRGIKNAAELYLRATGIDSIDYSMEAEDFVYTYLPKFIRLPYFSDYDGIAQLLARSLIDHQPVRHCASLAVMLSTSLTASEIKFDKDMLFEEIEEYKKTGYRLPAIATDFIMKFGPSTNGS